MDSWPNQEALNKALNIYRVSMRSFIIFHLRKIPGMNVEDVVIDSVGDWRADEIDRILSESDRDIRSVIDINDFPHLVNKNWAGAFERTLNDDKTFRNQLWLIVECRNADWAHPPEGDADFESTRAHLFLIADVLGKINKSDAKDRVEVIRDELDDTAERLADVEECLKKMEAENAEHKKSVAEVEKHLETAKLEKSKYEKDNATLSEQIDEKEKRLKKLSKQLKNAKAETEKYKRNLADTKKRLEKSEAAQMDYKQRFETISKEVKEIKTAAEPVVGVPELYSALSSAPPKKREPKLSIADRYRADTSEEQRDEIATQVVELRINATGSRPLSWRKIRGQLGLKNDQFHKVIRHSPGYRKAVIDRIQKLRARPEGWAYSGKLEFLTGIQISESELE